MNPIDIQDYLRRNPLVRTVEDSRPEPTMADLSRDVAAERNDPQRNLFAIARVIAARGSRHRVLRRASNIF